MLLASRGVHPKGIGNTHVPTLLLPKVLAEHLDHGLFLSLPKIKAHRYAVVSLGIKGMQGVVMRSEARPFHAQKWRMHEELLRYMKTRATAEDRRAFVASLEVFGERNRHADDVEAAALVQSIKETAKRLIALVPELPREAAALLDSVNDPSQVADLVISNLDIEAGEKQEVLAANNVRERLRKVLMLLTRQLEILKVRERINSQVQEEMGHSQREYVLRQQLKAIKGELGEMDDESGDAEEFSKKITEAKMPEEAEKVARKQLDRLKSMQPSSAEYTVTRTYLEWLTDLPWSITTEDLLDIGVVRDVLNEDHYDLEKVKKRILEYMAVLKLNASKKGPILCLLGPPGVGKTSLGKSIARAIGRKFVRISLGGVRDEAEIRGHRRTYVGSLPGRIVQALKRAGTNNPVIVLDEIDKLGHDFRGDPGSALLEVLDPEQNWSFSDHYLEVPFDLSKVMFIATANYLDPIPPALKDRLEILRLPGYTR